MLPGSDTKTPAGNVGLGQMLRAVASRHSWSGTLHTSIPRELGQHVDQDGSGVCEGWRKLHPSSETMAIPGTSLPPRSARGPASRAPELPADTQHPGWEKEFFMLEFHCFVGPAPLQGWLERPRQSIPDNPITT